MHIGAQVMNSFSWFTVHDSRRPAVDLEQRLDMLHEVELLVTR
jgi:hypothetical protein